MGIKIQKLYSKYRAYHDDMNHELRIALQWVYSLHAMIYEIFNEVKNCFKTATSMNLWQL